MFTLSNSKFILYVDGWIPRIVRNWESQTEPSPLKGSPKRQLKELRARHRRYTTVNHIKVGSLRQSVTGKYRPYHPALRIEGPVSNWYLTAGKITLFFEDGVPVVTRSFISGMETVRLRSQTIEEQVEEVKSLMSYAGLVNQITNPEKYEKLQKKKKKSHKKG